MKTNCKVCTKEYDSHEVTQCYGLFFPKGYCTPKCYTEDTIKNTKLTPEYPKVRYQLSIKKEHTLKIVEITASKSEHECGYRKYQIIEEGLDD